MTFKGVMYVPVPHYVAVGLARAERREYMRFLFLFAGALVGRTRARVGETHATMLGTHK